jgi:hypothetical protein
VAHFGAGHLELFCADPPPEGDNSIHLDGQRFVRAYYEPLLALLAEEGERVTDDDPFLPPAELVHLSEMDLWIGLTLETLERLRSGADLTDLVPAMRVDPSLRGVTPEPIDNIASANSVAVGSDGVVVALGPAWEYDLREMPGD